MAVAEEQAASGRGKLPAGAGQDRPRRRRPGSVLAPMLLAGLVLAVAAYAVLRDQGVSYQVALAGEELRPGETVTADAFEWTEVDVAEEVAAGLVEASELADMEGSVAASRVGAGELVSEGDLRPASAPAQLRAMSLPVAAERAVGGELAPGDRVDVAAVVGGTSVYVASDLEVLGVSGGGTQPGALGQTGQFAVTVAVDGDTGLALARALETGTVSLLRSTGAAEVDTAEPFADTAPEEG